MTKYSSCCNASTRVSRRAVLVTVAAGGLSSLPMAFGMEEPFSPEGPNSVEIGQLMNQEMRQLADELFDEQNPETPYNGALDDLWNKLENDSPGTDPFGLPEDVFGALKETLTGLNQAQPIDAAPAKTLEWYLAEFYTHHPRVADGAFHKALGLALYFYTFDKSFQQVFAPLNMNLWGWKIEGQPIYAEKAVGQLGPPGFGIFPKVVKTQVGEIQTNIAAATEDKVAFDRKIDHWPRQEFRSIYRLVKQYKGLILLVAMAVETLSGLLQKSAGTPEPELLLKGMALRMHQDELAAGNRMVWPTPESWTYAARVAYDFPHGGNGPQHNKSFASKAVVFVAQSSSAITEMVSVSDFSFYNEEEKLMRPGTVVEIVQKLDKDNYHQCGLEEITVAPNDETSAQRKKREETNTLIDLIRKKPVNQKLAAPEFWCVRIQPTRGLLASVPKAIEADLTATRNQAEEARREKTRLDAEKTRLDAEKTEIDEKLHGAIEQLRELEKEHEAKLKEARKGSHFLEKNANQIQNQRDSLQADLSRIQNQRDSLQADLEQAQNELTAWREKAKNAVAALENLGEELEHSKCELEHSKCELEAVDERLKHEQESVILLARELEKLGQQKKEFEWELTEALVSARAAEQQLSEEQRRSLQLGEEMAELKEQQIQEAAELESKLSEEQRRREKLALQLSEERLLAQQVEKQKQDTAAQLEEMKVMLKTTEADLKELKERAWLTPSLSCKEDGGCGSLFSACSMAAMRPFKSIDAHELTPEDCGEFHSALVKREQAMPKGKSFI